MNKDNICCCWVWDIYNNNKNQLTTAVFLNNFKNTTTTLTGISYKFWMPTYNHTVNSSRRSQFHLATTGEDPTSTNTGFRLPWT